MNKSMTNPFYLTFKLVATILIIGFQNNHVQAQNYGSLPMGGAGFISGIVKSKTEKGLEYVRTDVGGAYRRDSASSKWIPLTDWVSSNETGYLGVESMALDPNNTEMVYLLVGISYFNNGKSAVLRSSNRGKSFSVIDVTSKFKAHGNGMGRNSGEKLAVDPNLGSTLYCGSRANGLFKSTDSASTWTRVSSLNITTTPSENGISFVIFDPTSGSIGSETKTILVGVSRTGENFYRTNDGGATFTAVANAPSSLLPHRAVLASDSNLYITYTDKAGPWDINSGQLWKYHLTTGVWTNITPKGFTCGFGGISVDPSNANRLVASTLNLYQLQGSSYGDHLFLSTDGGKNWVDVIAKGFKYDPDGIKWNDYGQIHWASSIEFDPFDTQKVSVVSGNGLFTCHNIDSTTSVWKFDVKGIEETVPYNVLSIPNGPTITAVADYDGCRYTDISQYSPQHKPTMGNTFGMAYAYLNHKIVVRVGSKFYYSEDTAKTWKQGTINGKMGYVCLSADGSTILHSPEGVTTTYKSIDKGNQWVEVKGIDIKDAYPVADPINDSIFYAYNSGTGKMMVSLNRGGSFFSSGLAGANGSKRIRTVPGFEGHLWVALYNGGLKRSVNGGASFNKLESVASCSAVGIGKTAPNSIYPTLFIWGTVDGTEGLYFSTDQGISWNRMNDSEHEWGGLANGQFVIGDMNELGLAYLSTAGRGIVTVKPDILLSTGTLTIPVDGSAQIEDTILNSASTVESWSSNNNAIAAVDESGLVKGIAPGVAIITATTNSGKSITIAITVANSVTNLVVTPQVDSLDLSETVQLSAEVIPSDATNKNVIWSSINPAVATINSTGLLKGMKTGSSIISAMAGGNIVVSFKVVVGVPLESLSFNPNKDTLDILEKKQLTLVTIPANTTDVITWTSSKSSIASVDATGVVTGKTPGGAIVYATSADKSMQAACNIVVTTDSATAIQNPKQMNSIMLYPNPLNGNQFTIDLGDSNSGKTTIQLIDVKGQTVFENTYSDIQNINVTAALKAGVYLVQIKNRQKSVVKMLTVL
jgi:xyloglucan-specific exo-beta-1,4-glucanase